MIFFLLLIGSACHVKAQSTGPQVAADRIAQKMKDSLGLSQNQRTRIYNANLVLHQRKQLARQQYTQSDSLRVHLQSIENTRDALYQQILPADKYLLYIQKKVGLVSVN